MLAIKDKTNEYFIVLIRYDEIDYSTSGLSTVNIGE